MKLKQMVGKRLVRQRVTPAIVLLTILTTAMTACGVDALGSSTEGTAVTLKPSASAATQGTVLGGPATSATAGRTILVIGDSISTGYQTSVEDSWPNLLVQDFDRLGEPVTVINAAENGAGYLVPGAEGRTFDEQAKAAVTAETAVVVVYGSENDIGEDLSKISDKVQLTAANVREQAPGAKLVFVGPASYDAEVDPELLAIRDQIQSGAQEASVEFIDPISNQWIMGKRDELIGPDGGHPSVEGHVYLSQKFEAIVAPMLNLPVP